MIIFRAALFFIILFRKCLSSDQVLLAGRAPHNVHKYWIIITSRPADKVILRRPMQFLDRALEMPFASSFFTNLRAPETWSRRGIVRERAGKGAETPFWIIKTRVRKMREAARFSLSLHQRRKNLQIAFLKTSLCLPRFKGFYSRLRFEKFNLTYR